MGKSICLSDSEIELLIKLLADLDAPETEEDEELSERLLIKLNK
jgi:hypothetical protein